MLVNQMKGKDAFVGARGRGLWIPLPDRVPPSGDRRASSHYLMLAFCLRSPPPLAAFQCSATPTPPSIPLPSSTVSLRADLFTLATAPHPGHCTAGQLSPLRTPGPLQVPKAGCREHQGLAIR